MAQEMTECWELDPEDSREAAWMLSDLHRDGYVVACGGMETSPFGERVMDEEVIRWLAECRRTTDREVFLIPVLGEAWFALTQWYLSTGLVLLVHLPAGVGDSYAMAADGVLGEIGIFPEIDTCAARERDLDLELSRCWWRQVWECLPVLAHAEEEIGEIKRLVRATAALNELAVGRMVYRKSHEISEDIAPGDQDLFMLSVMLISSFCAMRRSGGSAISVRFERIEEGISLVLRCREIDATLLTQSDEISFCRSLAEENGQIFSCRVRENEARLTICAVRKEFALLGVKTDPELF